MSQALLISNDDVLECIYSTNLTAYVGLNVTTKHSLEEAIKLLDAAPNLDIIISMNKIDKTEVAKEINSYLEKNNIDIPLMVIGACDTLSDKTIHIKGNFDIKNIVRGCAKVLDVSAQDMAEKTVPNYYPIPIRLLENIQEISSDIYFRTKSDKYDYYYTKIIPSGKSISDVLEMFSKSGADHLYVKAKDRLKIINQTSEIIVNRLKQPDITTEERNDLIEQGIETISSQLFEEETTATEIASLSRACVDAMKQVMSETPNIKKLVHMLLENKAKYPYFHSIVSSYLAAEIIKNISWGSKEQAEKVTFVLFFHDIFLTPLFDKYPEAKNENDLLFGQPLTEEEKEQFLNHAKLAGDLVSSFRQVPIGADSIIRQHHGTTSGIGFAIDFKDDVSPLSKVIIIAEDYVNALLSKFKGDGTISFNQKDIIKSLKNKYTRRSYQKIIEALENLQ